MVLLCATIFAGCGKSVSTEKELDTVALDEAMSEAHFISLGDDSLPIGIEREITQYHASCKLVADGDMGYLVLGDRSGEHGTLFLVGIGHYADEDGVKITSYKNGVQDNNYRKRIEGLHISDDGYFEVEVAVNKGVADITINGEKIDTADMPFTELGCVGACKDRGMNTVFMDDIMVKENDNIIFCDDFDGNFINELYPYEYSNDRTSAFSPFFIKTSEVDGSNVLVVSSGIILSETGKDSAPVFKKEFDLKKSDVVSAHLCMTALGSFEAYINSQKVSDSFFDPGKMVYDEYLDYVTYDVTNLLRDTNELKIYLFHGFYDTGLGYPVVAEIWGEDHAVKGALVINYKNGKSEVITTDESFSVSADTRYRFNDIYQGEMIDDRYKEDGPWEKPKVDMVADFFKELPLSLKESESIAPYKELTAVNVNEPVPGHYVYDFGENVAGTIRLDLTQVPEEDKQKGQVLTFRYGEIINSDRLVNPDGPDGTVWTDNLLTAKSRDYYVFGEKSDDGEVLFSHTYHGFRFLEITGTDKPVPKEAVKLLAISSDLRTTGQFTCSDEVINTFYDNSVRSLRSNMMDDPTDCPQRDERLGWTGDAQAVSGFAMYQFDALNFYRKYLKEIRTLQEDDGMIYDVAPSRLGFGGHSCWGDVITTIPWNLYLQYGDEDILSENIDAASRWVDYLVANSDDDLFDSEGYGDHLSLQAVSSKLSDTAWCAYSARLVSRMHKALGDNEQSEKYADIADKFSIKWQDTFISKEPSVETGILYPEYESETAYALGLEFGLFPEDIRQDAADRLKLLSDYGGYLFGPGYSGMAFYLPALCENGYGDVAARVMTNTAPGGIAHLLSLGLTSNAESVDAYRYTDHNGDEYGDGKYYVNGSLNHAAFSSVSEACYKYILGIRPDEEYPGYEHFYIEPLMTQNIASASGSFDSVRGEISVSWNSTTRELSCSIPATSRCTLILPSGETIDVSGGEHSFTW